MTTTLSTAKLTTYKGYYVDLRNGVKCGVSFTYNIIDNKMVNEVEYRVTPRTN